MLFENLFKPLEIAGTSVKNRIFLAPLMRLRVQLPSGMPSPLAM
ncbi:N-ethylmaleimide reductase [Oligella sp. MSHR50489EDL]